MDRLDIKILNALQKELPLTKNPFGDLASNLSINEFTLFERLLTYQEQKLIRRIGISPEPRKLGYSSILVGARVQTKYVESVAEEINKNDAVTHNYERPGWYNLWFTLFGEGEYGVEEQIEQWRTLPGIEAMEMFPADAVFKLLVHFNFEETRDVAPKNNDGNSIEDALELAEWSPNPLNGDQIELLIEIQKGLPLSRNPWEDIASKLDLSETEIIESVKGFIDQKVVRKFGGFISHRKAGFTANGMVIWSVEENEINERGVNLAQYDRVTHCYSRPSAPNWPYRLYTMIHARSRDEVHEIAAEIACKEGIDAYDILFSKREFKKSVTRLFVK